MGQTLNIGWSIGEEILFKAELNQDGVKQKTRKDICKAVTDSCVLAIKKRNITNIKRALYDKAAHEEYNKFEIVLRGNHIVKKGWR